jgi:ubiquinone biosynthesis protein COQ4
MALRAVIGLLRDPQDTRQVFLLTEALRGRSSRNNFERFRASPVGRQICAERRSLLAALTDRARLAALPDHTLGRAYLAFMVQEDFTAEALVDIAQRTTSPPSGDEAMALYAARMRDMHDLYHVLTGYGRDELGEICVLAFSYQQQKIRSFWVISRLGMLHIARILRRSGVGRRAVVAAVREATRHGRRASWLPGEDLEALLAIDLETLRTRLNIPSPVVYQTLIAQLSAETMAPAGTTTLKTIINMPTGKTLPAASIRS